jgi:hypothetical protein
MTVSSAAFRVGLAAVFAIAMIAFSPNASASVVGQLDITNCTGGGVTVTATTIDWLPAGGGSGCIMTGSPTSVSFSGGTLSPGTTGTILDLTAPTTFPVVNFMTFTGATGLHFDLSSLGPGPTNTVCSALFDPNQPACAAVAGSPFILAPTATGTSVTLSARGTAGDSSSVTSTWIGAFTTQISGVTPAQIQANILRGGAETSTYSGDFRVQVVPEPATLGTMLLGGLLVAAGYIRRRSSN